MNFSNNDNFEKMYELENISRKLNERIGKVKFDKSLRIKDAFIKTVYGNSDRSSDFTEFQKTFNNMKKLFSVELKHSVGAVIPEYQVHTFSSIKAVARCYEALGVNSTKLMDFFYDSKESFNIGKSLKAIEVTLNEKYVNIVDFSLIRTLDLNKDFLNNLNVPQSVLADLRKTNKGTAFRLAKNNDVIYNGNSRTFISSENQDAFIKASEINVVSTGCEVLEDIGNEEKFTEGELANFVSYLSENLMFGYDHEVAKKIYNVIENANSIIDFDKECYYHSRARDKNSAPYVWGEMQRAPWGISGWGRYNYPGQPYFYFSNTTNGAANETKIHINNDGKIIQIAKISPKKHIKMLDLSAKSKRGFNIFLKHLRFPLDCDTSKLPRVYLLPAFVSNCCKKCGLDGIKYYGGKDYSNYVTWNESYFDFCEMFDL